jgi:hypothetical protein
MSVFKGLQRFLIFGRLAIRIWSPPCLVGRQASAGRQEEARGGGGVRCRNSEGSGLPFALLLRGLDWLGVGADFEVGILQGGEGEAIVAISLKVSFHISLLAQRTTRETKKQLYGSTVEGQL